jgi:multidrug efflux pump subunit AcrA (membrane-fusion protein)
LRVALENQKLAELEVRRAEAVLQLHIIRSPFDGVVVDRLLDPGEFATTNIKEPILKLAEIDPLNVEVVLPAALFGRVRRGDRAEVLPETSTRYFPAQVSIVDRVIDGASGTFGVRLDLRNRDGAIPAGARCRLRFAK